MYNNQLLYTSLKDLRVINEVELDNAFAFAEAQKKLLGDILLDENLISEEDLEKLIAEILNLPYIDIAETFIPKQVLNIIPEGIAKKYRVISFKKDGKGLYVGMENPNQKNIIDYLQKQLRLPIIVNLATKSAIDKALNLYLKDIGKAFEDVMKEAIKDDPPIIKIVDTILNYAYENNASDIHLEPKTKVSLVRFRIDGVLHDIVQLSLDIYPQIVTRIKVMAKLRTDEHQIPQDGKIAFNLNDGILDIRCSIVPISRGEKVVMRLLSEKLRQISLQSLGFSESDLAKVTNAYQKPYGMILATGPTGSGKTTTMYTILKLLNKRDVNIMTIEDPVEYDIDGINQIQVNPKANLTFATGLRSILRQDPNIVLVGEIRDEETADIAINAAMTGHLVLSTLHTNDAATAIPRLFDMKIEPFLAASTVNVIIAQRLVRKIHNVCRISEDLQTSELVKYINKNLIDKIFGGNQTVRIYKGKGCEICHNTGYEGRIGIYEVMELNEKIRTAIVDKKDTDILKALSTENGMTTMIEDGLLKVKEGMTTIEEILRVTKA